MISFKVFSKDVFEECYSYLFNALSGIEADELRNILDSLLEMSKECEVGVSSHSGCLLMRMYDDGYFFVYPIEMTEDADADTAINELRLYSIKEEIPFVLADVPKECAQALQNTFKGARLYADDGDEEIYVVEILNECANTDVDADYSFDCGISLIAPADSYVSEYAKLCRDVNVNKFWGYDFRADADGSEDGYFLREARSGFNSGCVATFFVLLEEKFIGEAILYYFDYLGGAECGIRLLPEYMGQGLGRKTLESLICVAHRIGLERLYATVKRENTRSIALFKKYFELEENDGENIKFSLIL